MLTMCTSAPIVHVRLLGPRMPCLRYLNQLLPRILELKLQKIPLILGIAWKMARVPINRRILMCDSREIEFSGDAAINLSDDTVFQFLSEECEGLSPPSSIDDDADYEDMEDGNENENRGAVDENFWETQHQLLQVSLFFLNFLFFLNSVKQNFAII